MTRPVVYIGGYSRSGSTLLDILLGSHDRICGTGELTFLVDDWDQPDRHCTCGRPYQTCEFWKDLYPTGVSAPVRHAVRMVEARRQLPRLLRSALPRDVVETYRESQSHLFDYIRDRSGCPIVLDSSKSARAAAGRALALGRLAGQDVYFVHLVRDGLSTLRSYQTNGSNWSAEAHGGGHWAAVPRAGVGWTLAHTTASLLAGQFEGRSLLLRYEDLVSDPLTAFARLGGLLGLDLAPLAGDVASSKPFFPAHQVGGNRLRFEAPIRLKSPSSSTCPTVPRRHAIPFVIYGGFHQRRYGYPVSGRPAMSKAPDV